MDKSRRSFLKRSGACAGAALTGFLGVKAASQALEPGSDENDEEASNNGKELSLTGRFLPRGMNQSGLNSGKTNWIDGFSTDYTKEAAFDDVFDEALVGYGKFFGRKDGNVKAHDFTDPASLDTEWRPDDALIHWDELLMLRDGSLLTFDGEEVRELETDPNSAVSVSDSVVFASEDSFGFLGNKAENLYEIDNISSETGRLRPETLCSDSGQAYIMNESGDILQLDLPELDEREEKVEFEPVVSYDNAVDLGVGDNYLFVEVPGGLGVWNREEEDHIDQGFRSDDGFAYSDGRILTYVDDSLNEIEAETGEILASYEIPGVEDFYGAGNKAIAVKQDGTEIIDLENGDRDEIDSKILYADANYKLQERDGQTSVGRNLEKPEITQENNKVYLRNNQDDTMLLHYTVKGEEETEGLKKLESGESFRPFRQEEIL